jgi:hypothetical protein
VPLLASRTATNNPRTAWEPPQRAQSTWRMSYYCTYLNEKKREKKHKIYMFTVRDSTMTVKLIQVVNPMIKYINMIPVRLYTTL